MARKPKSARNESVDLGGYELRPGILISLGDGPVVDAVSDLADKAGLRNVAYAEEYGEGPARASGDGATMTVFSNLGVAVADLDPDQESAVAMLAAAPGAVQSVEPEPIFFAFQGVSSDFPAYLRGYRDAVDHIYDRAFAAAPAGLVETTAGGTAFRDDQSLTWGLRAIGVGNSHLSGRGVRVAILDTGFDIDHPDFRGRSIQTASFIPGQDVQDDNGHGTHCIGTACGPRTPTRGRRYGIAFEAEIYAGKVLSNQGGALGRSTLAGIEWAVRNKCHIISMSLGGLVLPGQSYLQAFETTARNALKQNSLIIAAAGNDSRRSQGMRIPVSSPANCPSILAVAAIDSSLRVADFSNAAVNPDAQVDIAAPGVDVFSSAPDPAAPPQPPRFRQWPAQYETISGTSMATPHVAGVAALLREANPGVTAGALWRLLVSRASPLPYPASDVGSGLLQL